MLALLVVAIAGSTLAQAQPAPPAAPEATTRRIYLPMLANPGARPQPGGVSSGELIDAAEQRGEISSETALIYRVFARFADPRLPAGFRGDDSGVSDVEVAGLVLARYDGLSAAARETLAPFLLPPFHAGSWWELQQSSAGASPAAIRCGQSGTSDPPLTGWAYFDSSGGAVRVWWQTRYADDEAKARAYADQIDQIWLRLASLLRRQPPSDEGANRPCRGGDNRLDVAIVDLVGAGGEAWPYTVGPAATPSYILMARDVGRPTLIHELMHSFQFAFPTAGTYFEYHWWREGTAAWSEHYIDPNVNSEHRHAGRFLNVPGMPLETFVAIQTSETTPGRAHQYGTYLLSLYEQLNGGGPDFVRRSWEAFGTKANSLEAINGLLDGGFRKTWPRFVLNNVNRPPVDQYRRVDGLRDGYEIMGRHEVALGGAPSLIYPLDGNVPHLAAHTTYFKFTDLSARSVTFENPYANRNMPTASVQAVYITEDGQRHVEDWTNQQWTSFCRDVRAERIEELMIVIGNSEWADRTAKLRPTSQPRLHVTNMACRGWEVNVQTKVVNHSSTWEHTSTMTTTATFERVRPEVMRAYPYEYYRAARGNVQWSHVGHIGRCAGQGSGSYSLNDPDTPHTMIVENYGLPFGVGVVTVPPESTNRRGYYILGVKPASQPDDTVTYRCPGNTTPPFQEFPMVDQWLQTEDRQELIRSLASSGRAGSGTFRMTRPMQVGQIDYSFTWQMRALPPE